ncbi:hypothetical protein NC652_007829 [Populus alba x Populus x berolinensis]|nr:hypothetical protein NC652_007829 [Populus alba x Populus x berolinensis]
MKRRKERNLSLDPPHYELLISYGVLHHPHPSLFMYLQTNPPKQNSLLNFED